MVTQRIALAAIKFSENACSPTISSIA